MSDFNKSRAAKDGRQAYCRPCSHVATSEWWKQSGPYVRQQRRERQYKMARGELYALHRKQNGRCAICRTELGSGSAQHVDHCHDTGQVRGLLCRACNLGIGHFYDDPVRISAALEYLQTA